MEKPMHLISLIFLSASCAAENITVVYGIEGGTISVNCTYNPWQQRWREKSWCKQIDETKCQHVVSARRFWLPFLKNRNGTTSISDNVREGVLTVTMKRLKKQDAGLYQCRTDYLGETNSLRKVQVEVLTAVLETQMPEEPSAVQSISSRKNRETEQKNPNLSEHQVLPFAGDLAHDGISPSWESTA
ncbi:triggering receptor expressed on myeloid cells 2-like isoform 2-T2 [Pluvialis apricaria]